jgi:selenium metabolism protein YedF
MLQKKIDNRGLSCPQPVINTKKVLDEMFKGGNNEFTLTVIVDNEAAKENVSRLAGTFGCEVSVQEKEDGIFVVIHNTEKKDHIEEESQPEANVSCCCASEASEKETVLLITSSTLGQGSEELGKILMRSFIYTLKETEFAPSKILFLNSGVYLTTEGSPVLDELKQLTEMGIEIFSCGTCLDYYKLKEKLEVGIVTNMYDIADSIRSAGKCITL